MTENPFTLFAEWFAQAQRAPLVGEPTAMCLATATPAGMPSSRMVLLKASSEAGFVFYTNLENRKSVEIKANPRAALTFFWELGAREKPDQRQVRIEGDVVQVSDEEADRYYASRPLESRIGAWASEQSRPLASLEQLQKRVADYSEEFGMSPPRPPHWSGWRVVPSAFEFWKMGDHRLHERARFAREGGVWVKSWLNP